MFTTKQIFHTKCALNGMHEHAAKVINWLKKRMANPTGYWSAAIYTKLTTSDIFRIEAHNWMYNQINRDDKTQKTVQYSYPTSPNAEKFKFKEGCWTVELIEYTPNQQPPKPVAAFATKEEAVRYANAIHMPYHWTSRL